MSILQKLKCMAGAHQWTDWIMLLERDHGWYPRTSECVEKRVCQHCEASEWRSISRHQWSEWRYEKIGDCELICSCTRCGAKTRQIHHAWGDWEYPIAGVCTRVRRCGRCGEQESKDHDCGENDEEYVCRHCGEESRCDLCGAPISRGERPYCSKCSDDIRRSYI